MYTLLYNLTSMIFKQILSLKSVYGYNYMNILRKGIFYKWFLPLKKLLFLFPTNFRTSLKCFTEQKTNTCFPLTPIVYKWRLSREKFLHINIHLIILINAIFSILIKLIYKLVVEHIRPNVCIIKIPNILRSKTNSYNKTINIIIYIN